MLARDARPSTTSPSALLTGFWFLRRTPVDCKLPARCDVSGCLLGAHEYYRRHNIPSDLKISTTESPPSSFSTAETPYNSNRLPPNANLVVNQRAAARSKETLRNRCRGAGPTEKGRSLVII